MRDVTLSFIDVETGGLDERRHGLLEVGIVRLTAEELHDPSVRPELLGRRDWLLRPIGGKTIEPEAFDLHGLYGRGGLDPAEAYGQIREALRGTVAAGHNVEFDLRFLGALAHDVEMAGIEWANHHKLDVAALVMPAWLRGEASSCSLSKAAVALGVEIAEPAHRAISDCVTAIRLYRKIVGVADPPDLHGCDEFCECAKRTREEVRRMNQVTTLLREHRAALARVRGGTIEDVLELDSIAHYLGSMAGRKV